MVNYSNPLTLLILKKKSYTVRPRARAKKQEYSFTILLFPLPRSSTSTLFMLHPLALLLRNILILIRSPLAPTHSVTLHSHLAFRVTIFFFSADASINSAAPQTIK
jgi:hypothetical protein